MKTVKNDPRIRTVGQRASAQSQQCDWWDTQAERCRHNPTPSLAFFKPPFQPEYKMPRWAWPRLFSVLWLILTTCERSSYSSSPPVPDPPWRRYPLKPFFSPYDGYFPLCWRAVVARTTEFRNRRTETFLLAFFCQASDTTHTTALRFSDYGKPFVPQNSLMTLSTNFPRRSSVTLQEKWSPATTQRLSSVSLVTEAMVATLPFPYTPRRTKVTQVFKPNASWGRGKREARGTTPLGASAQWQCCLLNLEVDYLSVHFTITL